jgi:hypothetical protein
MSLISRLTRIGRLTIAPIKGFFTWETRTSSPRFDPERMTFRAHLKEVARRDTILFYEPFTMAIEEFKRERSKPR